jgi:hypothetical protein
MSLPGDKWYVKFFRSSRVPPPVKEKIPGSDPAESASVDIEKLFKTLLFLK